MCFGSCSRNTLETGELDLLSTISQYVAIALTKQATDLELRAVQAKLNRHALELDSRSRSGRQGCMRLLPSWRPLPTPWLTICAPPSGR